MKSRENEKKICACPFPATVAMPFNLKKKKKKCFKIKINVFVKAAVPGANIFLVVTGNVQFSLRS